MLIATHTSYLLLRPRPLVAQRRAHSFLTSSRMASVVFCLAQAEGLQLEDCHPSLPSPPIAEKVSSPLPTLGDPLCERKLRQKSSDRPEERDGGEDSGVLTEGELRGWGDGQEDVEGEAGVGRKGSVCDARAGREGR